MFHNYKVTVESKEAVRQLCLMKSEAVAMIEGSKTPEQIVFIDLIARCVDFYIPASETVWLIQNCAIVDIYSIEFEENALKTAKVDLLLVHEDQSPLVTVIHGVPIALLTMMNDEGVPLAIATEVINEKAFIEFLREKGSFRDEPVAVSTSMWMPGNATVN